MLLGALHEGRIGFPGHKDLGTRHYVQLVSDGPQACKDESWRRILGTSDNDPFPSPWRKILRERGIDVLDGGVFGSGQYMAKELEKKTRCIAVLSEGRELWEKNAHQGSTLESALLKLYDGTQHWTGSFENKRYGSNDIHLSSSFVRATRGVTRLPGKWSSALSPGVGTSCHCALCFGPPTAARWSR